MERSDVSIAMVGEGVIARKHLAALAEIDRARVDLLVGADADEVERVADASDVAAWSTDFEQMLGDDSIDAVVLATPTPLHAEQTLAVLEAGKHVLVEIPMADDIDDARRVAAAATASDRVAMVCHTRRFRAPTQWIRREMAGGLELQHLMVQTLFLRRDNMNSLGVKRSWADHLLWHHACHSVDLFHYLTGEEIADVTALQGPVHPDLGIAMDMTLACRSASGSLLSIVLSFNNDGPFGTTTRYICDRGTWIAQYDGMTDGSGDAIDARSELGRAEGIEEQDREFVDAIVEGRRPEASIVEGLASMETLERLARLLT